MPYALLHSFASLLLHEGRSVMYVARELGHDARLTLTTYGHVMDELDDAPRLGAGGRDSGGPAELVCTRCASRRREGARCLDSTKPAFRAVARSMGEWS